MGEARGSEAPLGEMRDDKKHRRKMFTAAAQITTPPRPEFPVIDLTVLKREDLDV